MISHILSIILTLACVQTDVLIVGDSQSGRWSWGGAIEEGFVECGADVERYSLNGWSTPAIWEFVQGERNHQSYGRYPGNDNQYEIVFVISGDNDLPLLNISGGAMQRSISAMEEIVGHFEESGSYVFFSIPPRRTMIANMELATTNFPFLAEAGRGADFWLDANSDSRFPSHRLDMKERLIQIHESNERIYPLDIVEIAESNGIDYPTFPDGIHIPHSFAQELADCLVPFNSCRQ